MRKHEESPASALINITKTCPCDIQIFLKMQKMKFFNGKVICSKHRLWVLVRTASAKIFSIDVIARSPWVNAELTPVFILWRI